MAQWTVGSRNKVGAVAALLSALAVAPAHGAVTYDFLVNDQYGFDFATGEFNTTVGDQIEGFAVFTRPGLDIFSVFGDTIGLSPNGAVEFHTGGVWEFEVTNPGVDVPMTNAVWDFSWDLLMDVSETPDANNTGPNNVVPLDGLLGRVTGDISQLPGTDSGWVLSELPGGETTYMRLYVDPVNLSDGGKPIGIFAAATTLDLSGFLLGPGNPGDADANAFPITAGFGSVTIAPITAGFGSVTIAPVPLPAALWLLGPAVLLLGLVKRTGRAVRPAVTA